MPAIYDFECRSHHVTEHLVHPERKKVDCSVCGKVAKRIISVTGQYMGNQDAPWLKSTLEVVDRSNPAPHVQAFVKNPTRANYKAWMKREGIRPMDHSEHGGPPIARKPDAVGLSRVYREVINKYRERNSITI
jgi:hypothetical protein